LNKSRESDIVYILFYFVKINDDENVLVFFIAVIVGSMFICNYWTQAVEYSLVAEKWHGFQLCNRWCSYWSTMSQVLQRSRPLCHRILPVWQAL